jgi:hypothetical protein
MPPPAGSGVAWWYSPLADEREAATIERAMALLDGDLHPLPPHADISMLRHLRTIGSGSSPSSLAKTYEKALRWRRKHVPEFPGGRRAMWPSMEELAEGEWAKAYTEIGFCIGRAKGGMPVKIERIGNADLVGVSKLHGGPERLRLFYYSLLEALLTACDAESAATGQLVRMYEIFDMKNLSSRQATFTVLRFMRDLVTVITTQYCETTCRAVLLNMPVALATPVRFILAVLPERVAARVLLLGEGERFDFLYEDVDDEVRPRPAISPPEIAPRPSPSP